MPTGYVNIYECPRGCKAQGDKPIAASIRGWKKHMTRQHGGYEESELAAIVGAVPPSPESGRQAFLDEMYRPLSEPEQIAPPPTQTDDSERMATIKKEAIAKKFSAKMNKFKEKLSARITDGVNLIAADKGPEWEINEKDRELISESFENCFEILDIDFQMRPITKTLENPLWVLLLPIVSILMVFLPKAFQQAAKAKAEKEGKSDSE